MFRNATYRVLHSRRFKPTDALAPPVPAQEIQKDAEMATGEAPNELLRHLNAVETINSSIWPFRLGAAACPDGKG